jgi:signal transduction histidine kinase
MAATKRSFRLYVFIAGTLLATLTSVLLTLYATHSMSTLVVAQFDQTAREISLNFAFNARSGIITQIAALLREATPTLAGKEDVLYAIVYDADFKELHTYQADSLEHHFRLSAPRHIDGYLSAEQTIRFGARLPKQHCLDTWREVRALDNRTLIGYVRLGLSMKRLDRDNGQIIRGIVLLSLCITALIAWLAFIFSGVIIKPITQLSTEIRAIMVQGTGDDSRIQLDSFVQEIDTLKEAFNRLLSELNTKNRTIRDYADNLERKVKEKTDSLTTTNSELIDTIAQLKHTQSQLIHAEKLAGIGQVAAGVAHEINNPIGFVSGNNETLSDYFVALRHMLNACMQQSSPEQLEQLRRELDIDFILNDLTGLLNDNAEGLKRVKQIVANLKNFSRIDDRTTFTEVDIEQNLHSTLMVTNNEIKYDADVALDFGNIEPIVANAGELNQVFLNMIVNAAQALRSAPHKGRGTITITTRQFGDHVTITIADNGPGIPEAIRDKIFDPFFTTKEVGKGTGLGLNISWDIIVNRHKGSIKVDSTLGEGTAFVIELPRSPAA